MVASLSPESSTTERPQTSPAGGSHRPSLLSPAAAAGVCVGRPSSRSGSEPSRQRMGASRKKSQPSKVAMMMRPTMQPLYDYRQGLRTDILKRIDHLPVVQLYPGQKIGGAVNSQSRWANLATDPGSLVQPGGPKMAAKSEGRRCVTENPETQRTFGDIVNSCSRNQQGTRDLFQKMLLEDGRTGEGMSNLHERIRIMQSMPDLSMPEDEFENFVANAICQQRALDAEMQEQLNAGFAARASGRESRGQTLGSIRHIFPLRDVRTGRVAKGEMFTRWRY